ncbi:hypothetical protein ACM66B_002920 [Microbotryomycetes sp. NB124-2]
MAPTQDSPPAIFTVHRALQRSRQTILNDLLPVYSPSPPPAQSSSKRASTSAEAASRLQPVCTATVKVGPHIFYDTVIMCADELATSAPASKRRKSSEATSSTPALAITPALIKRLNVASASNSDLAQSLRKAANGTATQQELATLARKIDEIQKDDNSKGVSSESGSSGKASTSKANATSAAAAQAAMDATASNPPPVLVIQFKESPDVRFRVPSHFRHSVHASAKADAAPERDVDVLLSFFVHPDNDRRADQADTTTSDDRVALPVDMVIEECDQATQEAIAKCSRTSRKRDPKVEDWWKRCIQQAPYRFSFVHPPPPQAAHDALLEDAGEEAYPLFSRVTKEFSEGVPGGLGRIRREQDLALTGPAVKVAPKRRRRR